LPLSIYFTPDDVTLHPVLVVHLIRIDRSIDADHQFVILDGRFESKRHSFEFQASFQDHVRHRSSASLSSFIASIHGMASLEIRGERTSGQDVRWVD